MKRNHPRPRLGVLDKLSGFLRGDCGRVGNKPHRRDPGHCGPAGGTEQDSRTDMSRSSTPILQ